MMKMVETFSHGKRYRFREDFDYDEPYPLPCGIIPRGTVVVFKYPNLGYATFTLVKPIEGKRGLISDISLNPKIAFKVLEEE
jgi:hypothetical protein